MKPASAYLALFATAPFAATQEIDAAQLAHDRLTDKMVKYLELPSERPAAAQTMLRLGDASVPSLIRALRDPRSEVTYRVAMVLAGLPNLAIARPDLERFASGSDRRLAEVARWILRDRGWVVVAAYDRGEILTLDLATGQPVMDPIKVGENPYDAKLLPNGNYLVAMIGSGGWVQEIDENAKRIWRHQSTHTYPLSLSVDALPTGHLLITESRDDTVREVDRSNRVLWQYKCESPCKVERLANGNTLIADRDEGAREVDPSGKIVWEDGVNAYEAIRLANGNTLIANFGRGIRIVTPKGRVVRSHGFQAKSAKLLPCGDIIAGGEGVVRLDANGKKIWERKIGTAGSVEIY